MATNSQAKSSIFLPTQALIDLTFTFRRVVQALEKISARYVVVGSTAASAWGVARSTRDIDVVAVITSETVDAFLRALGNNEIYVPVDEAKVATIKGVRLMCCTPQLAAKLMCSFACRLTHSNLHA